MTTPADLNDLPAILTAQDLLDILPIARSTLYLEMKSGRLPAAKIGRQWFMTRDALIRHLEGKEFEP